MNKQIRFGHTAITWANEDIAIAVPAIAACGYWGTETFGWVLEEWEVANRNLLEIFQQSQLQLTSLYCHLDIMNPDIRQQEIGKVLEWVELYKKYNGAVVIIGGKMLERKLFSIDEHIPNMMATLNELAEQITDKGLLCCFHPHTGTPVETEEEIHRIMDAVDTRVVTFAPDLGQIAKGGSDPLEIVKAYHDIIKIIHLKDYLGGPIEHDSEGREVDTTGFLGYTPLGEGSVNVRGILDYLEEIGYKGYAQVELDGNQWSQTRKGRPMHASLEAVQISKAYLQRLGYDNFKG
ncbi:sugar phosphate isomerase/epimerase family protein [Paenibacillus agricola]|uniref:TIM barrel protein n=1 Tax=Paenibacillus agricola TaxID=2716264 RepID=A0ABX0JH31_9BACL|nr:sugar phosphate isomerase/epimerase [Paenibacillus agricola]NHN33609.1 TIM barrel protein [Paenibacillus agricola]